jgi:hypothetical protein
VHDAFGPEDTLTLLDRLDLVAELREAAACEAGDVGVVRPGVLVDVRMLAEAKLRDQQVVFVPEDPKLDVTGALVRKRAPLRAGERLDGHRGGV